jgi:hypothetical protein
MFLCLSGAILAQLTLAWKQDKQLKKLLGKK